MWKPITGVAIIVGCLGGFGYIVYDTMYAHSPAVERLDSETLCPIGIVAPAHTIVLVDETDPITPIQRKHLREIIDQEAERLPFRGKLTVLSLNAQRPYEPDEFFSMCTPKRGKDVSWVNGNPPMEEGKWNKKFGKPLDHALDALLHVPTQPRSPIIEAIKGLTLMRYDFTAGTAPGLRLVGFSDFLQNSGGISHYTGKPDFASYVRTAYAAQNMPDLSGVVVRLEYISRPETIALQGAAHKQFWRDFFRAAGAQLETPPFSAVSPSSRGKTEHSQLAGRTDR